MRIGNLNTALRYGLEDDASFHSKIKENTEEHTPSLVYSDWLREQGREGEADFIKGSVEQDRGASSTGFRMPDGNRTVTAFNWGGRYNVYLWHHDASAPNGSIYWLMKKVPADVAAAHVGRLVANGVLPAGPNTDQLLKTEEPQKHFSFGESLKYSVADEGSFHSKLVEQPDDHTAHSVYADFLREQGKEQTAHFIQMVVGSHLTPEPHYTNSTGHSLIGKNNYGDTTGRVLTGVSPDKEHSGWSLDHNGDDTSGHLLQLYQSHNGHTIEWRHVTRDDPRDTIEALRNEGVKITSTQLSGVKDAIGEWEEEQGRYGTLAQALKYTLAEPSDFHTAIHNDPDEASNAGVYADFLQEQGKDAHAELIRHHIAASGTGGVPHSEQSWEADGVTTKPSDRPALHTKVHLVPKHDYNSSEPVGYAVHLNQMSPDRLRSVSWESGVLPLHHALDLHKRLVGEGAQNDPRPTPVFGESRPVKGSPVEIYSEGEQPVRYAAVPEHDIHSDYSPAGVAPRIGHLLNRIAGENSDAGLLAEGVLRTGDHSLLKILADKLDDDGHELGKAIDWRHAERAIKIDRALAGEIGRHQIVHRTNGVVETEPQSAGWTLSDWRTGRRGLLSRKRALDSVRKSVPDANRADVAHSVLRLLDNQFVRQLSQPGENYSPDYVNSHMPPAHRLAAHIEWAKELGGEGNPHSYADTRPANKRYRLAELVEKYQKAKYELADESSFHNHLIENRYEQTPALVYADWLQEQGKDAHSELVRQHVNDTGRGPLVRTWHYFEGAKDREALVSPDTAVSQSPTGNDQHRVTLLKKVGTKHVLEWSSSRLSKEQASSLADRLRKEAGGAGESKYAVKYSHEAFQAPLHADQHDHTTGMVYGDWLEEQGLPHHAEIVRRATEGNKEGWKVDDNFDRTGGQVWKTASDPYSDAPFTVHGFTHSSKAGHNKWTIDLSSQTPNAEGHRLVWTLHSLHPDEAKRLVSGAMAEGAGTDGSFKSLLEGEPVKHSAWKAPVGGLIVKESPLAVTGTFSEGGSFTPDLTKLGKALPTEEPAKKPNLRQLLKRLRDRKRG
jgi:uncharacterized protein (TIGR02996 family)